MSTESFDLAGRYTIYINGFRDEAAREAVAAYLETVMRGKTLEELRESLENLPFLLIRSASGVIIQKLKERLEERGASLDIVSLTQPPTEAVAPPPEETAPQSHPPVSAPLISPIPQAGPGIEQPPHGEAAAAPRMETIPWEDREEQGFFASLWATFTEVMFSPSEFYSKMPPKGKVGSALLYAVLLGILGLILSAPTFFLLQFPIAKSLSLPTEDFYALLLGFYTFAVFFSPLIIILIYFVLAAVYHLCILLVGGSGGFDATLKVIAYSASTSVFQVLPYVGGFVGGIYSVVLWAIGFQKAHKLSPVRAGFAALLPIIVGIVLFVSIIALTVLFLGAAFLQGLSQRLQI